MGTSLMKLIIDIKHDKYILVALYRHDRVTAGEAGCNHITEIFVRHRVDNMNGDVAGVTG